MDFDVVGGRCQGHTEYHEYHNLGRYQDKSRTVPEATSQNLQQFPSGGSLLLLQVDTRTLVLRTKDGLISAIASPAMKRETLSGRFSLTYKVPSV